MVIYDLVEQFVHLFVGSPKVLIILSWQFSQPGKKNSHRTKCLVVVGINVSIVHYSQSRGLTASMIV